MRQNTQITQNNTTYKEVLINNTTHALKRHLG